MRAELKRAADLVAFQRREALSRKRLSGDPRNPFRPRYGAELTFAAASQEAETLGYILKLLEKEAARECARRVFPHAGRDPRLRRRPGPHGPRGPGARRRVCRGRSAGQLHPCGGAAGPGVYGSGQPAPAEAEVNLRTTTQEGGQR